MKVMFAAAAACLALTGCASIFSGTTQEVAIRSTPGAKYVITNTYGRQVASGVVGDDASLRADLTRGVGYFSPHAYKVALSKPGHRPATVNVDPGMNAWYFGNILFGGLIGMVIVDPWTGAMYRLVPRVDDAPLDEDRNAPLGQESGSPRAKVSARNDYAARQQAKARQCQPLATPEVIDKTPGEETLIFQCEDGRNLSVVCRSGLSCT